ncbi:MAG: ribonuclease P protein component, partial [Cycloclasticus sp.]
VLAKKSAVPKARLGLAIAKKSVKKAVKRNLIKRIIRESFRRNKADLSGYDFVVLSRQNAATANKKQLAVSIEKHWKKLARCWLGDAVFTQRVLNMRWKHFRNIVR